jgi:hypothetical protein
MFFDFCDTFFAATHNTGIYYGVRYCLSLGGANMDDTRVELVLPNGVILDFLSCFWFGYDDEFAQYVLEY